MPPLIFFDIDQTLAESKQPIAPSMADALAKLLASTGCRHHFGDTLEIVMRNVADRLPEDADRSRLYLLPTSGAALYRFEDGWQQVYEESLSAEEAERIDDAILSAVKETGCIDMDAPAYGKRIENRGAQVSISALGQEAPLEEKRAWDPSGAKRDILRAAIAQRLPEYDVARGGMTTIDVTRKGVNKAYGRAQARRIPPPFHT